MPVPLIASRLLTRAVQCCQAYTQNRDGHGASVELLCTSEGLSYGEEELEVAYVLARALTRIDRSALQ